MVVLRNIGYSLLVINYQLFIVHLYGKGYHTLMQKLTLLFLIIKNRRSMSKNWIPEKELEYVELCRKWSVMLKSQEIISMFGWDTKQCAAVLKVLDAFLAAHAMFKDVDSTANRMTKNELKKETMTLIRSFANSYVRYNPNMDAAARLDMGIRLPDSTPTTSNRPTAMPDTIAEHTAFHYQHRVRAMNVETGKINKPAGVYGVRFVCQVGGERPATAAVMNRSQYSRKPVTIFQHDESDKGKPAYYAACYENSRGEIGPWSPVFEMYIA